MLFCRVEDYQGPERTRALAEGCRGTLLFPLLDPASPGGKWLTSPQGRRELDFTTGESVLLVYPAAENGTDFLDYLEGLCEAFAEVGRDIRAVYPEPAVLLYAPQSGKCVLIRLKNPSIGTCSQKDLVRRGLERIVRTTVAQGLPYHMMATESRVLDWVWRVDNAAPVMAAFAQRMAKSRLADLFGRLLRAAD